MKIISSFIVAFLVIISLNAQESKINIGLNGGGTVGDCVRLFSSTFNAEVNALFPVSKHFYVGPSISYYYVNGKSLKDYVEYTYPDHIVRKYEEVAKIKPVGIMPLSGAFRVYFLKRFSVGADVGYAFLFNASTSADNKIYYRPVISGHITKNIGIQASFSGVGQMFMFVTGGIVFTL
ncbi:MAG: hypothetical protein KGV44_05480 [Flavobacteriaceae bacterium]|nr:hypothetical protein [Flavobacteriaceae bacterium]